MSIQSQDTYLNQSTTLTVIGSGGGGAVSTYSTFTVSSLNALNLTAGNIVSANISSIFGEFDEVFCSSISTLGLILDDQILTAVGNELLLNGIPIATTANISTLADWSYDPAISTLNMNSNSSINASLTSTNVINAGSGRITNLVCDDISTTTLTVLSTLHVVSTISSVIVDAQAGLFSSINGVQFPGSISSFDVASISALTTSSINGLSYPPPNSDVSQWATFPAVSTITGGVGATDDLRIAVGRSLGIEASVSTGIVIDRGIDIGGPASFNVLAKNGSKGAINLRSDPGFAGLYGEINLTANGGTTPGLIGSGGLITLTANTPIGTDPTATSAIKLSAAGINSYAGAVPSFGSLLGYNFIYGTLGVNLCAGLPSVLPNVPGTTYLYGTTGITLGSQTNTGSDITQSAGGLYTTLVTGYWAGGVFAPQNLVIRGRQIPIYGNSYVQLSNVDVLSFDSGASKAITGLSTINGVAYPPAQTPLSPNLIVSSLTAAVQVSTPSLLVSSVNGGVYPPVFEPPANAVVSTLTAANFVSTPELFVSSVNGGVYPPVFEPPADAIVSTLTAANFVSTPELFVSSVNGGVYPPVFEPPANAVVSTLTAANFVSTARIYGLSTLYGESVTNNIVFDPNGGIIFNNDGADMIVDNAGSLTVRTDLIIPSYGLYVSSIQGVSSINGSAYPPVASVPADAVVSTLTAANFVSTPELFVSSVNGGVYPPVASVSADLTVSTLTLPTTGSITIGPDATITYGPSGTLNISATSLINISTALNVADITLSSINGTAYPPSFVPPADLVISSLVVSSFTSTLSLTVSSINGNTTSDPLVSTLSVAGAGNITLQEDPGTTSSAPIFFKSGSETVNEGILQVKKSVSYTDPSTRNYTGLAVDAFSTLGSLQPVLCASILLNPTPNVFTGAPITGNTAGDVIFPISSIIGISTINGVAYPPASAGGIQSTIANSGSFIDIDSGGNISSFSGNRTTITANSGGVHIIDSDNITTIDVMFDITMTPTSGAAVRINQAPLYVSSVYLSSINGAAYPPPGPGGSPNAEFSTLTVSSFGSIPQLTNVSSINDVNFNGGNINAQILEAQSGFNLAGAGTFTINGSTGGDGQVIQVVDGYPAWATPVRPAAYYSTSAESLPVFSSFSTVIGQTFTTQTNTGKCLVTGNVTFLNGDTVGDTLTTNLVFETGLGTAISTTGGFAAGYQNISLQYLIPQANLNPPGTDNLFTINIRKPDTDNSYTVTYATISVTTDLN